jgi:hypothetical protein
MYNEPDAVETCTTLKSVTSMRIRFSLKSLFFATFVVAVFLWLATWLAPGFQPVRWRVFSDQELKEQLRSGRSVLVLFEGRAGGMHQYVVTSQWFESAKLRRTLSQCRIVPLRANTWDNPKEIQAEMERVGIERDSIPVVAIYSPGRSNNPIVLLSLYGKERQAAIDDIVAALKERR